MSDTKASFLGVIKKLLRQHQVDEDQFLAQLSPDAREAFTTAAMTSWIPLSTADDITAVAAKILFAEHPRPIYELGRAQAHCDLTGIYKILLRVVSVEFAMGQTAKVWSTYHKRGHATVEKMPDINRGSVIVHDYPDLSDVQIDSSAGYIHGVLEMTGAKEVDILVNSANRNEIRFEGRWA